MFRIEIRTDNAAFADHATSEVARILRALADKLDLMHGLPAHCTLYDLNGNRVGFAQEEHPGEGMCWRHDRPLKECGDNCWR